MPAPPTGPGLGVGAWAVLGLSVPRLTLRPLPHPWLGGGLQTLHQLGEPPGCTQCGVKPWGIPAAVRGWGSAFPGLDKEAVPPDSSPGWLTQRPSSCTRAVHVRTRREDPPPAPLPLSALKSASRWHFHLPRFSASGETESPGAEGLAKVTSSEMAGPGLELEPGPSATPG